MQITTEAKNAILNCLANAAYATNGAQALYDALVSAFFPLSSITAVYTQSETVMDTTPLDDLREDLVVTAIYENGDTEVVDDYTLSGSLTVGTSTVTVSYGGKTTTFSVTVTGATQGDIFGTFTSGYSIGKGTPGAQQIPVNSVWNNSATGRAAMTVPIPNKGYVLTVTNTSLYSVAVYDVTDDTPHTTSYPSAVLGRYYEGGTKSPSWKTSDSASTAYIMVALKRSSGSFSAAELENGAAAVFTFTKAE